MSYPNTTERTAESGLSSHDLLGLSLTEAAEASEIFKRVHSLIYSKMGARLIRSMKDRQALAMEDSEMAREYQRGYGDGRESGLSNWPSDLSEFSVAEVVEAIRGPNTKDMPPAGSA